ncbi:MAG: Ku protein [Pirellulales bacterium]
MAARAIWKAVVHVGDLSVPVKLYSAVEDRSIHFHLLHDQDMVRLKQRMVNPNTDETVPHEQIRKGVEIERNRFVVLSDEDLESLTPPASRDIEISHFIEREAVEPPWFDRPYFLGPDGDAPEYFALAKALAGSERIGLAHWVMRSKQYHGALQPEGDYLTLVTLRHAGEVIEPGELEPPAGRDLDKKERDLATRLVAGLTEDFNPEDYQDEYRERVRQLIDTKRRGGTIEVEEYEEVPQERSLAEMLEASLSR